MSAKLSKQEMVANIISIWKLSTPQEKRDGIVWYIDAHKECQTIAIDLDIEVYMVAGVVAALSPNNRWEQNIIDGRSMINAHITGDDIDSFKVSTYGANKRKAWGILDEQPDYDHMKVMISGPKTTCFFGNIMGEDCITIDGHARNIAYMERVNLTDARTSIGKREMEDIKEAYADAAKKLRYQNKRVKAHELQAVTWEAWRRIHGITRNKKG